MNNKQITILGVSFVMVIIIAVTTTSYLYKRKIDEQFGLKTLSEVESNISSLNVRMDTEVADLNQLEEQVNSKKQIIATLSGDLSLQVKKQKDIKTAIYYLNKSLGIEQK